MRATIATASSIGGPPLVAMVSVPEAPVPVILNFGESSGADRLRRAEARPHSRERQYRSPMRILVVEDEFDLAEAVAAGLRREGYAVDVSHDGDDALYKLSYISYDLVCLDLNLPDVDGLEVCRRIRADGRAATPDGEPTRVLMLTARDRLDDRVAGLDQGADDYLTKPFEFPELVARVRSLLRRGGGRFGSRMEVAGLALDPATHEVDYRGAGLDLTAKEFALLRYFMLHPGQVLSAEHLLEHVWDENADPFTNTVRVTISNLRGKLSEAGGAGLIETVVGSGYRLLAE